jgi:hypothetical protein
LTFGAQHKLKKTQEMIMKTLLSALVALAVVAGTVVPASALTAQEIFQQIDRNLP